MTILVDDHALSELTKPQPDPRVTRWLPPYQSKLVVDPIVLGEIRFGILRLPKGKRRLEAWYQSGIRQIACLEIDADTGLRWAQLLADLRATGVRCPSRIA